MVPHDINTTCSRHRDNSFETMYKEFLTVKKKEKGEERKTVWNNKIIETKD